MNWVLPACPPADRQHKAWKDSNFKKSLSKYRLKKPIKKLYKVPSYNSLIDWTDELSNLETYSYYDRIITFVPQGFARRHSVPYKINSKV